MQPWVSFRELRERLSLAEVASFYGVALDASRKQATIKCPLPNHGGSRDKPTFSANLERGIFRCFKCGGSGNAIDLAVLMRGGDPKDGGAVRAAAVALQERFLGPAIKQPAPYTKQRLSEVPENAQRVLVNPPLDFELKDLDPTHPYLTTRGLTPETIAHFGLGYCERGALKGRIAIPLHDRAGKLVGYAGRLISYDPNAPKYLFPGERERKGNVHKFQKSLLLYNCHRIARPAERVVLVEGFPSVWWLHQSGITEAVACMGCSWSRQQIDAVLGLIDPEGRAFILADGDFDGRRGAGLLLQQIAPHRLVRVHELPDGRQPTDLCAEELRRMLPIGYSAGP